MKKKVTHNQAYKAMKKIVKYCKQTPMMCDETCIFFDEHHLTNSCALARVNPLAWEDIPTTSLIKKNLAEVLKNE